MRANERNEPRRMASITGRAGLLLLVSLIMVSGCKASSSDSAAETSLPSQSVQTTSEPASFSVTDLRIDPLKADSNQPVSVSVLVTNTGDQAGTHEVLLKLNDKMERSKSVSLEGGSSERVTFTVTRELGGSYTVSIGGLSGMYSIDGPMPLDPIPSKPPKGSEPEEPPPATTAEDTTDWTIPEGTGGIWRAVHMGGNWGTNKTSVYELPDEYFEYLRDLNVNWVGISVALSIIGSMDDSVALVYENSPSATFPDPVLRALIQRFRKHGFNVYIHVAIEAGMAGEHPVQRWQLGDPFAHETDDNIVPEFWPWRVDHPDHEEFVANFWQSYTDSLVHIAGIAEEEGAGLLTLGTETDRLFRSRSGGNWPNHFLPEMQALVAGVRNVYSGLLGYEQHCNSVSDREYFGVSSDYLVEDLDLDVIAVSAYFQLMDPAPTEAPETTVLEGIWENIFQQHLAPLQQRNGNKPIIFTEYGYNDNLMTLQLASADEFNPKIFKDKDGDGLDEGEETQRNIHEALFNVMERHPDVVHGAFLWDVMMATDEEWERVFGSMITFNIRNKLAEDMVRQRYEEWR